MKVGSDHPWEVAGLGKYPYRVVGVETRRGPIHMPDGTMVGAPGQPMGTCEFCFQGIADCFKIESSDGKRFVVGCDCVQRAYESVGERVPSLVKAHQRKARADKAAAKAKAVKARLAEILADPPAVLLSTTVRTPWGEERTLLEDLQQLLPRCGDAGRARNLKRIEKIIAGSAA